MPYHDGTAIAGGSVSRLGWIAGTAHGSSPRGGVSPSTRLVLEVMTSDAPEPQGLGDNPENGSATFGRPNGSSVPWRRISSRVSRIPT